MSKREKIIYLGLAALLLVLIAAALLFRPQPDATAVPDSQRPTQLQNSRSRITVYYLNAAGDALLPLSLPLTGDDALRAALERLLGDPPLTEAQEVFPAEVKLLDVYSVAPTLYVDLTAELLTLDNQQLELALQALAATALPLSGCEQLQLLIAGRGNNISDGGLDISQPLRESAVNPDNEWYAEAAPLLYYSWDDSGWLLPHTTAAASGTVRQLKQLAALLLPPGLLLQDCGSEDGAAWLELAADPQREYRLDAAQEQYLLRALGASVCALDGVDSLSLRWEDGRAAALPQGTPLDHVFTAPAALNPVDEP